MADQTESGYSGVAATTRADGSLELTATALPSVGDRVHVVTGSASGIVGTVTEIIDRAWADDPGPRVRVEWEYQTTSDTCPLATEVVPAEDDRPTPDVIKCQTCGQQTRSISRGCSGCGHGRPVGGQPQPDTTTDPAQPEGEALDGALAHLIGQTRNNIITEPPAVTVREMLADLGWEMSLRPLAAVRGEPHPCASGCPQETCAHTAAYSGQCGSCCDCYGACELAEKAKRTASGRGEPHTTPTEPLPVGVVEATCFHPAPCIRCGQPYEPYDYTPHFDTANEAATHPEDNCDWRKEAEGFVCWECVLKEQDGVDHG